MKLGLLTIFLGLATVGFSQRQYYILVESENRQPIYVRIGETTHNSSSIGHVIISALSDSVYNLEIGFPGDQGPSNQFIIRMNKKDHGYQLKKLNDKGWVLFDFQSLELIYPVKKEGMAQSGYSLIKRDDGFARLLSQVVNDTAVLYSIVYQKPPEPVVKTESRPRIDSPITKKEEILKEPVVIPKQVQSLPAIAKIEEIQSDSGKHIVYVDEKDSVRIFISSEPVMAKANSNETAKEVKKEPLDNPVTKEDKAAVGAVITPDAGKQIETVKKTGSEVVPQVETKKETRDTAGQQKKLVLLNSDCKALAWDTDVDKLRVRMLGEKDVDGKISIARKMFRSKCFTAAQIKGLTELFVGDQDKYKFLDAAYPFAFDTENFKQLSYLLTDEYYVKRFRTMVRLD